MSSLLLLLTTLAPPPPSDTLVNVDLARWPNSEVIRYHLDFAELYRSYLVRRLDWDLVHRDLVQDRIRVLDRTMEDWGLVLQARKEMEGTWTYPALAAQWLEDLRKNLGDEDYFGGRLPPLPDLADFSEIK